MTNAVEKKTSAPPALATGGAVAGIVPKSIEEIFRVANAVAVSGLAPKDMSTPEKLTIAIMTGMEVGLPPMQAIQSIAVINGRPTIWGDGLMAIVRQSPECMWIRETVEGDGDTLAATCETQRRGEPNPISRTFTAADAKRAGLWGKSGPWSQYPKRMLQMRARAWCLRDVYADVTKGIQSREETEDYRGPERAKDVTPSSSLSERFAAPQPRPAAGQSGFSREHVDAETGEIIGETRGHTAAENDADLIVRDGEIIKDRGAAPPAAAQDAGASPAPSQAPASAPPVKDRLLAQIARFDAASDLMAWWDDPRVLSAVANLSSEDSEAVSAAYEAKVATFTADDDGDDFPGDVR